MARIIIRPAQGKWSVRAGGAVLGESSAALELDEEGHAPVIYFPREDLAMAFLEPTERSSHCPHKGDASWFSIVTKSTTIPDAAWSYEAPLDGVSEIAGHVAFYESDMVTVERL
ncbi:DUF427 domain-containing protein [Rhodosalinus sp. K401]|uniref:DUF427 domain-containing protein n=1 Tax=Rhodosalinus sp. K401 TaxID=3239195 RepID=UPI0035255747